MGWLSNWAWPCLYREKMASEVGVHWICRYGMLLLRELVPLWLHRYEHHDKDSENLLCLSLISIANFHIITSPGFVDWYLGPDGCLLVSCGGDNLVSCQSSYMLFILVKLLMQLIYCCKNPVNVLIRDTNDGIGSLFCKWFILIWRLQRLFNDL